MFNEFFRKIFLGEEEIFSRRTICLHLALILFSLAFVYLFSYTVSFRYSYIGGDSTIFQLIGKSWLEGALPYKDIFDHKGPLIFLLTRSATRFIRAPALWFRKLFLCTSHFCLFGERLNFILAARKKFCFSCSRSFTTSTAIGKETMSMNIRYPSLRRRRIVSQAT